MCVGIIITWPNTACSEPLAPILQMEISERFVPIFKNILIFGSHLKYYSKSEKVFAKSCFEVVLVSGNIVQR